MRLKRFAAAVLASALLVLSLSGCGEEKFVNFDDIYTSLVNSIESFQTSNMQKQGEKVLENYYYIDVNDLEDGQYRIYMSDPATGNADEIAMFKVKDKESVVTIRSLIQDRVDDLKIRYKDYKPEEMKKLEDALILDKGNYVFLVVCSDNSKAKSIINKAF